LLTEYNAGDKKRIFEMNREEAEEKTCPFKSGLLEDRHGDTYLEERCCNPDTCMMWEDEKKSGNTTYSGGCRLKTMPRI
jgi:hypothetical protein